MSATNLVRKRIPTLDETKRKLKLSLSGVGGVFLTVELLMNLITGLMNKEVPKQSFGTNLPTRFERTSSSSQISGGDALLGNTRPHPEHDG